MFVGGETFSMCFWSDMKGKVLLKIKQIFSKRVAGQNGNR